MITEHMRAVFDHRLDSRLPRGELWLGTGIFTDFRIVDDVDNHIELCHRAGMDFVSLPMGEVQSLNYRYRRFVLSDLQRAAKSGLCVVAVLDGPFQRLVNEKGLLNVVAECTRNTTEAATAINGEAQEVADLIDACIDSGADAVAIADDIAYGGGMFVARDSFHCLLFHHYRAFADRIRHRGVHAVFHSCGRITDIVSAIVSAGFDGLSCENGCSDIASIKSGYGAHVTLFAGISCEFLEDHPSSAEENEDAFAELVSVLSKKGGLILSSSSGLYSSHMFHSITRLYEIADECIAYVFEKDKA